MMYITSSNLNGGGGGMFLNDYWNLDVNLNNNVSNSHGGAIKVIIPL